MFKCASLANMYAYLILTTIGGACSLTFGSMALAQFFATHVANRSLRCAILIIYHLSFCDDIRNFIHVCVIDGAGSLIIFSNALAQWFTIHVANHCSRCGISMFCHTRFCYAICKCSLRRGISHMFFK